MTGIFWLARKVVPRLLEHVVRPAGKALPPPILFALLRPFVAAVTFGELAYSGPTWTAFDRLPATVRPGGGFLARRYRIWRQRCRLNLAKLASYWSDLLATPRWRPLGRIEGEPASIAAVAAGSRPIILVTLHYGPFEMLYYGLRSRGIPVAILAGDAEEGRPAHRRRILDRCDRGAGLTDLPRIFTPETLRDAADFLMADRLLIVLATGGAGSHIDVDDGPVSLPLSPGPLRLAAISGADLIPFVITAGPRGTTTTTLGPAVPAADVLDRRRHRDVCTRHLRAFLPPLRSSPGQSDVWLLEILRAHTPPRHPHAAPQPSPSKVEKV